MPMPRRRLRSARSTRRWIGATLAALPVLFLSFALTNSNTVPASKAGDGAGAVSGFVISSVKYNLNAANPSAIDSVSFTLDSTPPAGSAIKMQLASGGTWYTCTNVTTSVTCSTLVPPATVAGATTLRVVVAQ